MISKWRAVVTGASSGIGKAIALALASKGSSVCIVGRNEARLHATAEIIRRTPGSVLVHAADLNHNSAVERLKQCIQQEFEVLDILVHCAGLYFSGALEQAQISQLDELYHTNLRMPFKLTQALLPMLKRQRGQVIFINSSQGLVARGNTGLYAATKHALKALADSLREEVNADGIRVLSVFPGRTATPQIEALYQAEGRHYQPELLLQAEDVAQAVLDTLTLPRTAEITNIQIRPHIKSY
jgi:NADP-dependent 3-hydroxy acid dehydrogenase YdfG